MTLSVSSVRSRSNISSEIIEVGVMVKTLVEVRGEEKWKEEEMVQEEEDPDMELLVCAGCETVLEW